MNSPLKPSFIETLYGIETRVFPPHLRYPKDDFNALFHERTICAVDNSNGTTHGFLIFNPLLDSTCGISDEDIASITGSGMVDKNFIDELEAGNIYYMENVASQKPGGLSRMLADINTKLPRFIMFHGRVYRDTHEVIRNKMEQIGYMTLFTELHQEFMGGDDFMFTLMERSSNRE